MRRKPLSKRQIVQVLLNQGATIPCGCGCGKLIESGDETIDEHLHQLGTGGSDDDLGNRRFYRAECSALKTNGSAATSYGSDAHARAKLRRLKQIGGLARANALSPERRHEISQKAAKARWGKRKIPSRPFPKRGDQYGG